MERSWRWLKEWLQFLLLPIQNNPNWTESGKLPRSNSMGKIQLSHRSRIWLVGFYKVQLRIRKDFKPPFDSVSFLQRYICKLNFCSRAPRILSGLHSKEICFSFLLVWGECCLSERACSHGLSRIQDNNSSTIFDHIGFQVAVDITSCPGTKIPF